MKQWSSAGCASASIREGPQHVLLALETSLSLLTQRRSGPTGTKLFAPHISQVKLYSCLD